MLERRRTRTQRYDEHDETRRRRTTQHYERRRRTPQDHETYANKYERRRTNSKHLRTTPNKFKQISWAGLNPVEFGLDSAWAPWARLWFRLGNRGSGSGSGLGRTDPKTDPQEALEPVPVLTTSSLGTTTKRSNGTTRIEQFQFALKRRNDV